MTTHPQDDVSGSIATSHHLATEAGARALREGGSAVDAAIAAAAALCVVYPNNVALGGDLVALVRSPEGKVTFINATGPAARAASLESMRAAHGDALPLRGIDTITVPGGPRGWAALADTGGNLTWSRRLESAVSYAREGVPTALSVSRAIREHQQVLAQDEGAAEIFLPEGAPLQEGEPLRQPALAQTLSRLAEHGPEEFYTGETARRWVQGLQRLGSGIAPEDLASYAPTSGPSMSAEVMGLRVHTGGPNTQGFALLRTLLHLEAQEPADPLGAEACSIAKQFYDANSLRAEYLSDPATLPVAPEELLTMPAPDAPDGGSSPAAGDTVGLSAASSDGWAVSLVQSVYHAFGSAVLEPTTGILFQNRGTAFSLDPDHPAALTPGARPPHTLMPVLAEEHGELKWVCATMGGQAQPQIHTHLLLNLLRGASPLEAVSLPRWVIGAQSDGDTLRTATAEADVPEAASRALGASFDLRTVAPRHESLGHSNVIEVTRHSDRPAFRAASDPRADGSALIV